MPLWTTTAKSAFLMKIAMPCRWPIQITIRFFRAKASRSGSAEGYKVTDAELPNDRARVPFGVEESGDQRARSESGGRGQQKGRRPLADGLSQSYGMDSGANSSLHGNFGE